MAGVWAEHVEFTGTSTALAAALAAPSLGHPSPPPLPASWKHGTLHDVGCWGTSPGCQPDGQVCPYLSSCPPFPMLSGCCPLSPAFLQLPLGHVPEPPVSPSPPLPTSPSPPTVRLSGWKSRGSCWWWLFLQCFGKAQGSVLLPHRIDALFLSFLGWFVLWGPFL